MTDNSEALLRATHIIFCEVGACGGDPDCFNGADEHVRETWIAAVRKGVAALTRPSSPASDGDAVERACESCNGFGWYGVEDSDEKITCKTCGGAGSVSTQPLPSPVSDGGAVRQDFSRITLRHNIEHVLREYRDAHPHTLVEKIMAVVPVAASSTDVAGLAEAAAKLRLFVEHTAVHDARVKADPDLTLGDVRLLADALNRLTSQPSPTGSEREKVVAWLRERCGECAAEGRAANEAKAHDRAQRHDAAALVLSAAADAIERGDHLRGEQ